MKKKSMKRAGAAVITAAALLITMAGCGNADPIGGSGGTEVVLNEVAHSIFYAPMYVAIQEGYFEEEGIKLTLVTGFGADKTMTAVLTGEADIGFMGSESTIYTYAGGTEDYVVNFAQLTQRAGNFLVSREPLEDFTWDMIKGKDVLGGRAGGMPEMVFEYILTKNGIDPKSVYTVSVIPCTAKKNECHRPEMDGDVDAAITTRELARMIKNYGLDYAALDPKAEFDDPIGKGSTAGLLFGATGGVMEAALRTVAEIVMQKPLDNIDFKAVRGVKGIKEATITLGGNTIKIAVVSGLSNARKILDDIKAGNSPYHFIEIMCCPGGCVNGGGQPQQPGYVRNTVDIRALRAKVLYDSDKDNPIRKSHENPAIKELYDTYLGKPGSERAHHLLHTTYVKRSINGN